MPRLFVGNFDFEHRLGEAHRVLPARLARLNAELATAWLAIADDGDWVWTPGEVPQTFWDQIAAQGLPRLQPVRDWTQFQSRATFVPWGWTAALIERTRRPEGSTPAPDPQVVRQLNSRRWSAEREAAWSIGLDHGATCTSIDDVAAAIARLPSGCDAWVMKAEFGMSARERALGRGLLRDDAVGWARRRLQRDGVIFFEPWVERIDEVGILWDVPRSGAPKLVGVAPMLTSEAGHYRGSRFAPVATTGWWDEAVAVAERAAAEVQRAGYFGPFGIDAMQYCVAGGEIRVRPLQDVNARWTMGRLALGWRRFFANVPSGAWWHGPASDLAPPQKARMIRTSPDTIDGIPAQHLSAIVVQERQAG